MANCHERLWKHPHAVRLARLVHAEKLTAPFQWHEDARRLVMDIEATENIEDLKAWKESALEVFARSDKLHALLSARSKYLGWEMSGAAVDAIQAAEARCEAAEAALLRLRQQVEGLERFSVTIFRESDIERRIDAVALADVLACLDTLRASK